MTTAIPFDLTLVAGLGKDDLTQRMALAARAGEVCARALAFYLFDMDRRGVHQELGFATTVQFAMNRLGMTKGRARELLATGRRLADLPALDRAFAEGELSWSKVRKVARVATPQTEQAWIARARAASHEDVEAMVSVAREGDAPPDRDRGLPRPRFHKHLALDAIGHELWEQCREKLAAELGQPVTDDQVVSELMRLFLGSEPDGTVAGRKKVDGSLFRVVVQGSPRAPAQEHAPVVVPEDELDAIASDAEVSPRLRRQVLERDGHRCQACGSGRSLMVHHVIWRSEGGETFAGNLVTLCARCHGLVHEEWLFVSGTPVSGWCFRDRRGNELHGRLPEVGMRVPLRVQAAHGAGAAEDTRPTSLRPDEIQPVVDLEWWRMHEHLFEWSRDGKRLRVKRSARATG